MQICRLLVCVSERGMHACETTTVCVWPHVRGRRAIALFRVHSGLPLSWYDRNMRPSFGDMIVRVFECTVRYPPFVDDYFSHSRVEF